MTLHLVHSGQRSRITFAELEELDRAVERARTQCILEQIQAEIRPRIARFRRRRAVRRLLHGVGVWLSAAVGAVLTSWAVRRAR